MYSKECKYCHEIIHAETKYKLGAHVSNCSKNLNSNKLKPHTKFTYNLNCTKCKNDYIVIISENNYNKHKYPKYCSRECANSRIITQEHKDKNRLALIKNETKILKCTICKNDFIIKKRGKNSKLTCSKECHNKLLQNHIGCQNGGLASAKSQNEIRRSKNEIAFANLCINKYKNVECNANIFNGWDADIIIHDLKIAILWNGKWHYEKITKKHSLLQVQTRDKIKIKEIIEFGYKPYIIKDLGKFNLNKVNEEFNNFLNINN